jgi:hypothetical protein
MLIYLWLFVAMLLAAGFVPSLVSLRGLKSRALRKGIWYKINPAARALIDAALDQLAPPMRTLLAPFARQ